MPAQTKAGLLALLTEQQARLKQLGVQRIGVFGSFVRNEARPDSDVDLLIEFEAGSKTFANFIELSYFLQELLGRKVELVTRESLSPYIGPRIISEVEYAPLTG